MQLESALPRGPNLREQDSTGTRMAGSMLIVGR